MAKRRAEDILLHDSPSKRCHRSICGAADMQLGSMVPTGGVRPPSLLALLGNRSRKRPHYFEDPEEQEEAAPHRKPPPKHAAAVPQTSGSFQDRRSSSSALTISKKRPREDRVGPETAAPKDNDKAAEDPNTEDCTYNSFQYWRPPLPELDLSLLEDASDVSPTEKKTKIKKSSDAMET